MENYEFTELIIRYVVQLAVWAVVGVVVGNKAKKAGLSFAPYFALTFLLGIIGVVISLIKINNQEKMNAMGRFMYNQNMNQYNPNMNQYNPNMNQYNQNMNQYNQNMNGYQQPNGYQQNAYQQPNAYQNNMQRHVCVNCGFSTDESCFCPMCGSKID
ncbi:MAG: hypothetical protein ACI4JW_11230 [Oscillospiraceae bacterium]